MGVKKLAPNLDHLLALSRKVAVPATVEEPSGAPVLPLVTNGPALPVADPVPAQTLATPPPAGLLREPEVQSQPETPEAPAESGKMDEFFAQAAEARQARDAKQEAVETATCVFSVPLKKAIQEAAEDANLSVAKWVTEAFAWCQENGITSAQVADAAVWVAEERNRKVAGSDGVMVPNRAAGSGVPIRASIFRSVQKVAKATRPRLSHASVMEGCAVIRLHALKAKA